MGKVLYIHGFNSSPQSRKAQLLKARFEERGGIENYFCPQLPHRPILAMHRLEEIIQKNPEVLVVGSSLGGYYATYLAEKFNLKAVLINPAVRPYLLLDAIKGEQRNYHTGETYELTQQHLDELLTLEVAAITVPQRYLLMVETGDEVLDYTQALERYRGVNQIVIKGGDHSFSSFPAYVEPILAFGESS
jgi:predicted esterase YcpF (UPF0227 family)